MARRCHIIYAHTAGRDGYKYFYLYFYSGDRLLTLKYQHEGDSEQVHAFPPLAMLGWVEDRLASTELKTTQVNAWDRMAKALRVRIQRWLVAAEQS